MEATKELNKILELKGDLKFKVKCYVDRVKELFKLEREEEEAEVTNNLSAYTVKVGI